MSETPLRRALKSLILALRDSANAFVARLSKYFMTLLNLSSIVSATVENASIALSRASLIHNRILSNSKIGSPLGFYRL